ncbi:MAG: hypothetical protein Q9208_006408 [Pyrenodesmia sp. 3 TL-2023]
MKQLWFLFLVCLTAHVLASPLTPTSASRYHAGESSVMAHLLMGLIKNGRCLDKRQPHDIQLKPINYRDCIEAAKKVMIGGKAGAPMHFSSDPKAGMEMPATWSYGRCAIRIDTTQPDDEDTFPMVVVANAASLLAERCTKPNTPGLGGMGLIGPEKVITMFVYGRDPDPPPPPRPSVPPGPSIA